MPAEDVVARARERVPTLVGLKLTNTLVVANGRGVLPEERMYLSGKPLHVLAATLADRLGVTADRVLVDEGVLTGYVLSSYSAAVSCRSNCTAVVTSATWRQKSGAMSRPVRASLSSPVVTAASTKP